MRVEIKHGITTTGMLKKSKFCTVDVSVTLSEEEKFMIKDQQIEPIMVLERNAPHSLGNNNGDWAIRFEHLLSGKIPSTNFTTCVEAKNHGLTVLTRLNRANKFTKSKRIYGR